MVGLITFASGGPPGAGVAGTPQQGPVLGIPVTTAGEGGAGTLNPRLMRDLRDIVGPEHVLVDPDVTASYAIDWTRRFQGTTEAVIRPGDGVEVAEVVGRCRDAGVAIVPQGGNTGLVGGGVPLGGEVVLSLCRLSWIDDVDELGGQLTAGAGTSIVDIQAAAVAAGWVYGIDLGSRDSATIGGTIATNAGGLQVLRYGPTRAQLTGAEAVLGTGATISHLGGLMKDNTGYDLSGLLCGSEGTLGVVTAARLRLVPPAPERLVALLAFSSTGTALGAAALLRRSIPELQSLELFLQAGLELVCTVTGMARPFTQPHAAYLLVEVAGQRDPMPMVAGVLDSIPAVQDVAVATEPSRRAHLWRYREAHTEAINTLGRPHKLDVTLPAPDLAAFIEQVPGVVSDADPRATTWLFGHAADGNVHVNITGVSPDEFSVDERVLVFAAGMGGSISAEHGIGTAKRPWLRLNRSDAELAAFRAIKTALDPAGIMNPNVLLPAV
ncbi:MAG TPA: FAD-binding oxidoreductase [Acidimicrobiales bacterium]|nr:FAD-binding oxidoreductase [Acidimicrobiales bacterium]